MFHEGKDQLYPAIARRVAPRHRLLRRRRRREPRGHRQIKRLFVSGEINLDYIPLAEQADFFLNEAVYSVRQDSPQNTIRFSESREFASMGIPCEPQNTVARERGMLTVDNDRFGRYSGEVQLIKTDRPADERVNCIGKLTPESMQILPLIGPETRVYLTPKVD